MMRENKLRIAIHGMRIALGVIFLWFGLLKIFHFSPVEEFVKTTVPVFGSEMGWQVLAIFETVLGVGLILNLGTAILAVIFLLHMIGTFSTFVTAPSLMFNTYPWLLTFEGEFVVKNIILVLGALIVLFAETKMPSKEA